MMYLEHYGLSSRPFEDRADPRFYVAVGESDETLASLEYEFRGGRGTAMLAGEAGLGKTQLIRVLLSRLAASHDAVVINWPADGRSDVIREAAKAFGVSLPAREVEGLTVRRLTRSLSRRMKAGRQPLIIIDQAEHLSPETLTQLMTLVDLSHEGRRLVQILLSAHPRLKKSLESPERARLSQQFFGLRSLSPLTVEQTSAYIAGRLRTAGSRDAGMISPEAVIRIHEAAGGVPRIINHLCDAALVTGYGANQARVTDAIAVEAIAGVVGGVRTLARERLGSGRTAVAGPQDIQRSEQHAEGRHAGFKRVSAQSGAAAASNRDAGHDDSVEDIDMSGAVVLDDEYLFDIDEEHGFGVTGVDPARIDERIERLERVLSRADRMTATITASLSQFSAVEKHLVGLSRSGQALLPRLAEGMQRAEATTEQTRARLAGPLAQIEDRARSLEGLIGRSGEVVGEVEEQVRRIERATHRADDTKARLEARAQHLADQGDLVQAQLTELMSLLGSGEAAGKQLSSLIEAVREIEKVCGGSVEAMRAATSEAKSEGQKIQTVFLDAAIRTCRKRLESQLEAHLAKQQAAVDGLLHTAEERTAALTERSGSVQKALLETEAKAARIAEQEKRLSEHVGELEGRIDSGVQRITEGVRTIGSTEAHLVQTIERGRQTTDALSDAMARAERHRQETDVVHGRYEAMQRAASVVMTDLGGAVERAHSLSGMIEEAERTIHRLGEQSRAAEGSAERLALTAEQTGVQERRLGELLASARAMHSEMEGTVANVDDKIGRLDSHHAAASTVLRNLGDTIKTAHELFKRAEDARNAIDAGVEQVAQRVDCLIRDVWSLTSRTETARDGLSTETGRAEDVLEKLTQTITPAESLIEAIRSASESAAGHADAINGQIVKAQEWTSRIDAFRAQLDELTARQATLAEAVRAAGSVHGELAADIGTAKDCAADLSAIAEDAGRLLESLSISRESARRDADRLAAQLHTVGAVLESAAPLLGDLHARAAEADRRMATVQENVSRLENRVEGALDAPRESIAAAQAQAAQLEKVVTAVRKVFASLSQATLDARTYAAQCDQSARHATQRLSELDAQTERSTRSLGQWIEEAVRAQQRLAAVLSSAPTIDQTHPMDAARAGTVGEVLSLSRETLGHELGTLPASRWARSAPGVEATSGEPCDEPAAAQGGGLPRSREIARLISDARQAVDSAEA